MCIIGIHGTAWRSTGLLVSPEGEVLSIASGGSLQIQEHSDNESFSAAQTLINRLLIGARHPGLTEKNCECICMASNGIRTEFDEFLMREILSNCGLSTINQMLLHDSRTTLAAGGLTNQGITIIAGSSSAVYGRDHAGNECLVGGWGTVVGDEGSGYEIGRAALKAMTNARDRRTGADSALSSEVMRLWQVERFEQILSLPNIFRQRGNIVNIAGIVPAVIAAAEKHHDRTAIEILERAAQNLFGCFQNVANRVRLTEGDPIIIEGGVIENSKHFRSMLITLVRQEIPEAVIKLARYRPVVGAAMFGLAGSQHLPSQNILDRLITSIDDYYQSFLDKSLILGPGAEISGLVE